MGFTKGKMTLILLAAIVISFIVFSYNSNLAEPPVFGALHSSPEVCENVDFEITKIDCDDGKMKVHLINTGSVDLNDTFLVIISTEKMQAFVGSSLDSAIRPYQVSSMSVYVRDIEGAVNRMEVVFQPCPFSTKILDNLSIKC
jgi:hypothetical protein